MDLPVGTYSVGIVLCKPFRDVLEKLKFEGRPVTWHEGRGWFRRQFLVRAPLPIHQALHRAIDEWNEDGLRKEAKDAS